MSFSFENILVFIPYNVKKIPAKHFCVIRNEISYYTKKTGKSLSASALSLWKVNSLILKFSLNLLPVC